MRTLAMVSRRRLVRALDAAQIPYRHAGGDLVVPLLERTFLVGRQDIDPITLGKLVRHLNTSGYRTDIFLETLYGRRRTDAEFPG